MAGKSKKVKVKYKFGPDWQTIRKIDSKYEGAILNDLEARDAIYEFHPYRLQYSIPASLHKYTCDFFINSRIYVEAKGRLLKKDAEKLLYVREQNPTIDLRIVFYNLKTKYNLSKKTTVEDWAKKHNFKYAEGMIPQQWLEE